MHGWRLHHVPHFLGFALVMTRPAWLPVLAIVSGVAVWVLLTVYAHAAVHPDTEMPSVRPETAKEAQQPKPRCVRFRTAIVTAHLANGAVLIAPMTIAVPC
jgi:hypothetical protein